MSRAMRKIFLAHLAADRSMEFPGKYFWWKISRGNPELAHHLRTISALDACNDETKLPYARILGRTHAICGDGIFPLDGDLDRWYKIICCKRRNKSSLKQLKSDPVLQRYYN